jgi:hypothetical protein
LKTKVLLALATLALALCAAQVAKANGSHTDPGGDATTAPDITAVTSANDAAGNLTFTVKTNQPTLAADALVEVVFDLDQNSQTGNGGVEAFFVIASDGWDFVKWDGAQFVSANLPSAHGSYANGVATFKISRADLGGMAKFTYWADSYQFDANDAVIASDTAPDGTAAWQYLFAPLTLRAGPVASLPARPAAGKPFAVGTAVLRADINAPLASGTVKCTVRVGTAPLRATGSISRGIAVCSMKLPKTSKGKLVRVTMKVTFQGVSTTKTYSARVV